MTSDEGRCLVLGFLRGHRLCKHEDRYSRLQAIAEFSHVGICSLRKRVGVRDDVQICVDGDSGDVYCARRYFQEGNAKVKEDLENTTV